MWRPGPLGVAAARHGVLNHPGITFAGDTHGCLDHLIEAPPDDIIIHVGDFAPVDRPVSELLPLGVLERFYFIPGNHDYDRPAYRQCLLEDPALAGRCLHGCVLQIGKLRVAGLGGIFKQRMWYPQKRLTAPEYPSPEDYIRTLPKKDRPGAGSSRRMRGAIWYSMWAQLACDRADLLVTHEAPTSHAHGFAGIDELARRLGATTVVHGHHHVDYAGTVCGGSVRVLGVGLRGLTRVDGRVLRAGMRSRGQGPR